MQPCNIAMTAVLHSPLLTPGRTWQQCGGKYAWVSCATLSPAERCTSAHNQTCILPAQPVLLAAQAAEEAELSPGACTASKMAALMEHSLFSQSLHASSSSTLHPWLLCRWQAPYPCCLSC